MKTKNRTGLAEGKGRTVNGSYHSYESLISTQLPLSLLNTTTLQISLKSDPNAVLSVNIKNKRTAVVGIFVVVDFFYAVYIYP